MNGKLLLALLLAALCCSGPDVGPQGPPGSADTPSEVLDKLNQATAQGGTANLHLSGVSLSSLTDNFEVSSVNFTKVPYKELSYDRLGEFDVNNSRFTPLRAGEYQVCASLFSLTPAQFEIDVFVNGGRHSGIAHSGGQTIAGGCRTLHLEAGHFLEVQALHESAGILSFPPNGIWNWLTIHRLP